MKFDQLPLPAEVLAGLADAGFSTCTPIQEQTLPISLSGKDVAVYDGCWTEWSADPTLPAATKP